MSYQPNSYPTPSDDHDRIAELLRLAGPGPEVPVDRAQRVLVAVREEWLDTLRARRRKTNMNRGLWALAAAAVLAIAVGIALRPKTPPISTAPPGEVATVNTLIGSAHLQIVHPEVGGRDRQSTQSGVRVGDTIRVGDILETDGDGLAAVQLASGQSLRINHSTRFWFESPSVIRLERGTVFFDSGADRARVSDIEIHTYLGIVHEVGTQFEVRHQDGNLRVRVREGAIDLETGKQRHRAEMGAQLLLEDGETLSRHTVPIYGPEWNWILALSPRFELEGSSLADFLEWVSRETGRSMQMSAKAKEAGSMSVTLHGSIDELPPDEALDAVLPTCNLRHAVKGGTVLIDLDS